MSAFFIGADGGLYTVERGADGAWRPATLAGAAGLAPGAAPVAAARLSGGLTAAALVGRDGAIYTDCPTADTAPMRATEQAAAAPGSRIALAQAGAALVAVTADPVQPNTPIYTFEVHNPCDGGTLAQLDTTLILAPPAPPPPGAHLAAAGLADGELGIFYIDTTGALQALWLRPTGAWNASRLTAPGTSTPGAGLAVTPNADAASGRLSLLYTAHSGLVYLAHPLPGGGLAGQPAPLPQTAATRAPDGAALAVSADVSPGSGVIVGYVAQSGAVAAVFIDASGAAQDPVVLTGGGLALPGSSLAAGAAADEIDFVCGTATGHPVRIKVPRPGTGPGDAIPVGPQIQTAAMTTFAMS